MAESTWKGTQHHSSLGQCETAMRYYFAPIRRAIIEKKLKVSIGRMWRNGSSRKMGQLEWKMVWRVLKKLKIELPCSTEVIPFLDIHPEESKSGTQRYLYSRVPSSIIHSVHRQMTRDIRRMLCALSGCVRRSPSPSVVVLGGGAFGRRLGLNRVMTVGTSLWD